MPGNSPLIDGSCVLILLLLAARAAVRIGRDRLRGAGRWHGGEATHLGMALGMALMLLPVPAGRPLLAGLFVVLALVEASAWTTGRVRRARGGRQSSGTHGHTLLHGQGRGRPEHVLGLHHAVVGGAMVVMALRPPPSGAGTSSAMPGMMMGAGPPGPLALTLFAYIWLSVLVLGGGLARAFQAEPAGPQGMGAVLAAPSTVYACELAMTVIMGLMVLA